MKTKLYLDAPNDPDSSWSDLQAFFDAFPQKHPYYPKVHISDFKIREESKTIRHSQYDYGPSTPDGDSAPVAAAPAAKVVSSVRRVVREPVCSARQKRNKREMSSTSRRSLREISSSSTMKTEEEVCFSSSRIDEVDVSFQGRINEIEEGSFLDNVTITDYVLKSDTFQTLLLFAKSWSLALSFVLLWKQECMECFQGLLPKFGTHGKRRWEDWPVWKKGAQLRCDRWTAIRCHRLQSSLHKEFIWIMVGTFVSRSWGVGWIRIICHWSRQCIFYLSTAKGFLMSTCDISKVHLQALLVHALLWPREPPYMYAHTPR